MHREVMLIAPRFGNLTGRLVDSFCTIYPEDQVGSYLYEESAYERRLGVAISRLLRVVVQILPCSTKLRRAVESFIGRVRFRRADMRADIMNATRNDTCTYLVLVKPTYLSPSAFDELRAALNAHRASIVLWDALWRTPSIESLLPHADHTFTTEPSDVERSVLLQHLPVPMGPDFGILRSIPRLDKDNRPANFYHCGSWSAERFVLAVRLSRAIRWMGASADFHLVTSSRPARTLNTMLGFGSDPIAPELNEGLVGSCDVLIDLGRAGQSSPSERLGDAISADKVLLTSNVSLAEFGPPIVGVGKDLKQTISECVCLLNGDGRIGRVVNCWGSNSAVGQFSVSMEEWAKSVLHTPERSLVDLFR